MKRIAWITTGFSKDENDAGGAAAIHDLTRELSLDSDIELTIFSLYYPFKQPEYNFYNAKVYSFAGISIHKKIDKPGIWRRCMKKFSEEHNKKKFDLIHSMWAGESGHIAAKISKRHDIPLLVNICGGELAEIKEISYGSRLKFWQKRFVDNSLNSADKIIAGSDYIVNKIKKYYRDKTVNKTVKIPFGVDGKIFFPAQIKNHENINFSLINIANAVPIKSHETLFKAVKKALEIIPGIKLKVYGNDEKRLKKLVKHIGVEKNVELHNFIEHNSITKVLNESGIFVLSSLYESQNMSIIEAAFCGLPVVSTDVGAAREVTENIVKTGDYEELAKKIVYVIGNYVEERKKAMEKIDFLKTKFSLDVVSKKFAKLYEEIINNSVK